MAKKIRLVTKQEDGTHKFQCPHPTGCGGPTADGHRPWSSDRWPTHDLAADRGRQHLREHETGADPDVETEVMPSLEEFRKSKGLVDDVVPAVNPDDWEL